MLFKTPRFFSHLHHLHTAGLMKTAPLVYTPLLSTICLSHSTEVADETVFKKHTASFEQFVAPKYVDVELKSFSIL